MGEPLSVDVVAYPRAYRFARGSRLIFVAVLMAGVAFLFWRPGHTFQVIFVPLIQFAMFAVLLLRGRVTIETDRIEIRQSIAETVVRRSDITGYRVSQGVYVLELNPNRRPLKGDHQVSFPKFIRTDAAWDAWFLDIPNLQPDDDGLAARQLKAFQVFASVGIFAAVLSRLLYPEYVIAGPATVGGLALVGLIVALAIIELSRPGRSLSRRPR